MRRGTIGVEAPPRRIDIRSLPMQIVLQSATFSYSLLPSVPLLPAPRAVPLLPAPKIAGLLPAECPRVVPKSPRKVTASKIIFGDWNMYDEILDQLEPDEPLTVEFLERV